MQEMVENYQIEKTVSHWRDCHEAYFVFFDLSRRFFHLSRRFSIYSGVFQFIQTIFLLISFIQAILKIIAVRFTREYSLKWLCWIPVLFTEHVKWPEVCRIHGISLAQLGSRRLIFWLFTFLLVFGEFFLSINFQIPQSTNYFNFGVFSDLQNVVSIDRT